MCPAASGKGTQMYWLKDQPTISWNMTPPVQNQWYTILDEDNVRLIMVAMDQWNNENAPKNMQWKWTIDGTVYYLADFANEGQNRWIYKGRYGSLGGTDGLINSATEHNAAFDVDKRGHHIKIEFRMTSAAGTNQDWYIDVTYEKLEKVA